MKKISILLVVLCALLVGCSSKKGLDGSLSEIMKEVYAGIPSDDLPDLENNKVTSGNGYVDILLVLSVICTVLMLLGIVLFILV